MKPTTLTKEIYRKIKHEIVTCQLLPGTPLQEQELSSKMNVSRTPVREALRILEVEGLVQIEFHRGARVAQISLRDIQEAYEARIWIEPVIAAKVALEADSNLIKKLASSIDMMPTEPRNHEEAVSAINADVEFHQIIIDTVGNRLISDLINSSRSVTRRAAFFVPPGRYRQAREEHLAILEAIKAQDPESTSRLMKSHIENSANKMYVFFRFDQDGAPQQEASTSHS